MKVVIEIQGSKVSRRGRTVSARCMVMAQGSGHPLAPAGQSWRFPAAESSAGVMLKTFPVKKKNDEVRRMEDE